MDASGRLYGTSYTGGTGSCNNDALPKGCGTVFELKPAHGGGWKEAVLYNFVGGESDGANPADGVTMDAAGNLFGVTKFGGPYQGTLYELTQGSKGAWTETVLHHFPTGNKDGTYPVGVPAIDSGGNLFGTTSDGGKMELGALWEASPGKHGSWSERVLYSFGEGGANDAEDPYAGVIFDARDNLYGTSVEGGGGCQGFGCGTVYAFNRKTGKLTVLLGFADTTTNSPESALLMDANGNLFGTTAFGGAVNAPNCQGVLPGCGSVYELSP